LEEKGIIDPVKVVLNSLEYGAGVASILLTSDVAIINDRNINSKDRNIYEHQNIRIWFIIWFFKTLL